MPVSSAGPYPSSAATGMPWMLPEGDESGRVDVAVGVDPEEAQLLPLPPAEGGDARHGARGDRVVAAEHQRKVAAGHDPIDLLARHRRRADDLGEVARVHVADLELLHVLDGDVAVVHDRVPQLAQPVLDPGDPDGGRPHVHAPPAGAEVHGDAQDVDDHEAEPAQRGLQGRV